LQGFLKTAKPEVKNKITNVIDLYSSRKIANFTTAENMIIKLKIADPKVRDANPNSTKKAYQKYDKLVAKYESLEPLNVRVAATKNKNVAVKRAKQNTASLKITSLFKNALRISVIKKDTAMDSKVVDLTMNFDYIGLVVKYDLPAILARSFLKAKQTLNTKQGFKFYSTIQLWITKREEDGGDDKGGLLKNPVFSGDFQSNQNSKWLDSFLEKSTRFFKAVMPST
jgi:hypothetical protein